MDFPNHAHWITDSAKIVALYVFSQVILLVTASVPMLRVVRATLLRDCFDSSQSLQITDEQPNYIGNPL